MNELHVVGIKAFLRALRGSRAPAEPNLHAGIQTYLSERRGRIVSCKELTNWLYADDPEGGPHYAENNVRRTVHRLRRRGVPIITHPSRGYSIAQGEMR